MTELAPAPALSLLKSAKRIVVKIGSTLVTNEGRGLDASAIGRWVQQIGALRAGIDGGAAREVILVSSGAIAEGMQRLGWKNRPDDINDLQAAAAVGQMGLVQIYESCFRECGLGTAQILLTHADLADRTRYLNARQTLLRLLRLAVVPVINENDTVVTDEIKFGDNDTLAALVTNLVDADALVILTDQRGLYSADPRLDPQARFVHAARAGDPLLESMAGGAGTRIGTGGMITKVLAARRAAMSGAHTIIASGREPDILPRLAAGESIGTHLAAQTTPVSARKQWLAGHLQLKGAFRIDAGAVRALVAAGKSLLPIGVVSVDGEFRRGEVVACLDADGHEVARGLSNYASHEARQIARKPTAQIAEVLGFIEEAELIHRDNLVLTARNGGGAAKASQTLRDP